MTKETKNIAIAIAVLALVAGAYYFGTTSNTAPKENAQDTNRISVSESQQNKFYTSTTVNVRKCASTSCEVIGTYPANTEIELPYSNTENMPEWVELSFYGGGGFVNKVNLSKTKTTAGGSPASASPVAPANNNLDSTCLSFYEKMKSLDILPVKETPAYTQAELKAIEMASQGEYDPALASAMSKKEGVENRYQNTIRANIAQKQDLAVKYGFCYEYLAKTYGFVID